MKKNLTWIGQFNYLMADRGEMEDFKDLQPQERVIELRKIIQNERSARRRDVTYNHDRVDIRHTSTDPDRMAGNNVFDLGSRRITDNLDAFTSPPLLAYYQAEGTPRKPHSVRLNTVPVREESFQVGDKVRVILDNHYYRDCTGFIAGLDHGKFVVEITSKSVPDKKNSKTGKAIMKCVATDLRKLGG